VFVTVTVVPRSVPGDPEPSAELLEGLLAGVAVVDCPAQAWPPLAFEFDVARPTERARDRVRISAD